MGWLMSIDSNYRIVGKGRMNFKTELAANLRRNTDVSQEQGAGVGLRRGALQAGLGQRQGKGCGCLDDDAYELLDQFAEAVARGEDASQLMPLVDQHIKMCPDCREEYEALLRMMKE